MGKSRLQIYFFHIRIIKNINCFQYDTQYIYIFCILFNTQNVPFQFGQFPRLLMILEKMFHVKMKI